MLKDTSAFDPDPGLEVDSLDCITGIVEGTAENAAALVGEVFNEAK